MATFLAELADFNMITDPGPGSAGVTFDEVEAGFIAFTGPGADTFSIILSSPEHDPQLTVNDSQTTANKLVLNSYKAGRAIIRVEPSQYAPKQGTGT